MARLTLSPGVELNFYDDDFTDPWRRAPAVLLQHGFSRSGKFWYNWVPLLSREFRVLRPDLRGMGESSIAEEAYEPSLDFFMADLNAILDSLGIDRVVYVGESFGGIIGLSLAHSFPDRVRALVLCNTPCRLPRRGRTDPGSEWQTAMRQSVGTWSTATIDNRLDTRAAPEGMKDWYISEMDRTSPEIGRKLQAYLDTLDFRPYLKEVATPTLLLTGEESPTSTLEQQRFMAEELPNSHLVVYPGLGHGINAIHPEWCVAQIREFLAQWPDA